MTTPESIIAAYQWEPRGRLHVCRRGGGSAFAEADTDVDRDYFIETHNRALRDLALNLGSYYLQRQERSQQEQDVIDAARAVVRRWLEAQPNVDLYDDDSKTLVRVLDRLPTEDTREPKAGVAQPAVGVTRGIDPQANPPLAQVFVASVRIDVETVPYELHGLHTRYGPGQETYSVDLQLTSLTREQYELLRMHIGETLGLYPLNGPTRRNP